VTFKGRVHVGAGNLHVGPSTSTVKLMEGLTGNLVFGTGIPVSQEGTAYTAYGDGGIQGTWGNAGTVELADGKTITGSITTLADGTGNMKFMGASAYAANIGTSALKLNNVYFNAATAGSAAAPVQTTIAGDVHANKVWIGNGSAYTTATLTPGAHALGTALELAGANTVLNMLGNATTANADGTLSNAGAASATVGNGGIVTNGATVNVAVGGGSTTTLSGAVVSASSGLSTTGSLTMNGNEKVNVTLLGSLRNGQQINLIDAASLGGTQRSISATNLTDNSFVIDTSVAQTAGGDLVFSASRANAQYVTKSGTAGHFSNSAALRLGTLAANGDSAHNPGRNYTADMQTVFNKLDLDQWGYGNNATNLGIQVKRLSPLNNGAVHRSAIEAGALALDTVGNRMASMRADRSVVGLAGPEAEGRDGQWVKLVGLRGKQGAQGDIDGFTATTGGLVWGADTRLDRNALLGLGLSATNTSIDQSGFREGDSNSIRTFQIAGYGAYSFTEDFYGEGSVSFGRHNVTGHRSTALGRTANADFRADQLTVRLGVGYRFVLDGKQTLTPMLNLESARLSSDAFTETGADALNLKFDSQELTRNRASLGLRYMTESSTESGLVYRPELMASVYRDNKGMTQDVTAAFAGDLTGQTFSTSGVAVGNSGYNLMGAVSFLTSKTSLVQLQLGYDHRDGYSSRSARLNARWDF
jgi:autotransporter family porin